MKKIDHLCCVTCGSQYDAEEVLYVCPACGLDKGTLDVVYDYAGVGARLTKEVLRSRQEASQWRYWEILPVSRRELVPPLRIGWTPLYRAERLGRELGAPSLWLKDDTGNPSASLKDRASVMAAVRAAELGRDVVTGASTGNAATSLSCVAAYMGLKAYLFVPERAPKAKVAQLLMYGATVLMVEGSYDECFGLCWEAGERWGWYSRNTAVNPYLGEGKKTAALEICEQLDWQAPDKVFCAVGDGCVFGGLHKGFLDFHRLGLIDRVPQLIGVQAEGAAPLVKAFQEGWPEIQPQAAETIADSICVGHPRDQIKALRAARQTGGGLIAVSDEEILAAQRRMARATGVFAEPAGAASLAGVIKMKESGELDSGEVVVSVVTGHGLKDVDSAMAGVGTSVIRVRPDLEDVSAKLRM
ncbi:MAG: threonine synthase [Nitrospinota bacterium]